MKPCFSDPAAFRDLRGIPVVDHGMPVTIRAATELSFPPFRARQIPMSTFTENGSSSRAANDRIQQAIIQQFANSPYHELRQIFVSVTSEQILLTGKAPSFFIKQMAQETARQACPVRKIQNTVRVV